MMNGSSKCEINPPDALFKGNFRESHFSENSLDTLFSFWFNLTFNLTRSCKIQCVNNPNPNPKQHLKLISMQLITTQHLFLHSIQSLHIAETMNRRAYS